MEFINDNWIINSLETATGTWNEKLAELWSLITQTPQEFRGGQIWSVISGIHSALVGIGYGLLVLFFTMGVFHSAASLRDLQRPEFALRHFLRFAAAKIAVGYGMELMTAIFNICGSVISAAMGGMGSAATQNVEECLASDMARLMFANSEFLLLFNQAGQLVKPSATHLQGIRWEKESSGICGVCC